MNGGDEDGMNGGAEGGVTLSEGGARYATLSAERAPAALEEELLARWSKERLFERTLDARADAPAWVFYEGPPTANGRPGIHHVFARTIKDLFCRHRAMRGFYVPRKAGWDTHGLPVEIEVEKQLGISGKQDIERVGVAEFNRLSRESVWKYKEEWEQLSTRMGYWLDYREPLDLEDELELAPAVDGRTLGVGFLVGESVRAVARVEPLT